MGTLRDRLEFDPHRGEVRDGPRRYLLMRADVLMGALRRLDGHARALALTALADAVREHGADSLRAYRRGLPDDDALLAATIAAAADLGWGAWRIERKPQRLMLVVANSPFAAGFGAAEQPVCAPIAGMLGALAQSTHARGDATVGVEEIACAACGAAECRFEARIAEST